MNERYAIPGLLILILILTGCGSPFGHDENKSVFRYNEFSNITSLDPAFARDQANIWACNQLFNGLLQLDDSLNIQPCIAKYWEIDSSGTLYTFYLRTDVFFHDHPGFPGGKGRQVTARDFVYSFNRLLDPKLTSPGTWVFSKVEHNDSGYAFKALNDTTFQIRLSEPFPPFAGILTMLYCSVVPEEIAGGPADEFRKNPAGTGPFRFGTWKENVKLVLIKNEHYFEVLNGQRLPFLDAVAITFLFDKQAAFLEFVKGNLDFISGLDPSYKDELLTRDGRLRDKYHDRFNMTVHPYLNTEYIGILLDPEKEAMQGSPLLNKKFRQALNYAFDREKMIRYLRNNIGHPGHYGILPPGLKAYDSTLTGYHYNPGLAQMLIREAGYDDPQQIPEITLHTTAEYVDLFKYLQNQFAEVGVKMNIEVNPAATLMQLKAHSKIGFFRASWIADYPDEENYLSLFLSRNKAPAGPNYSHFDHPVFDSLYQESQRTSQASDRIRLYRQMNHIIVEQAPVIILYYDQAVRFTGKDISGLGANPMNLLTLKRVKKAQVDEKYSSAD